MEGRFKVTNQAGLAFTRRNLCSWPQMAPVFSVEACTNGDRVYVGSNDTSFNGLVKLDKLESKSGNGFITSDVSFKDASKLQMGGTYNNNIDQKAWFHRQRLCGHARLCEASDQRLGRQRWRRANHRLTCTVRELAP